MPVFLFITLIVGAAAAFISGYVYTFEIAYIVGAALSVFALICLASILFRPSKRSSSRLAASVADQLREIDEMTGYEFETFAADLLEADGYEEVTVTSSSHDQGADIIMERDGVHFAVQCKVYSTRLGNTPVQEITAAREFYGCHVGVVITNSYFTDSAVELAKANRILLWDRAYLAALIDRNI